MLIADTISALTSNLIHTLRTALIKTFFTTDDVVCGLFWNDISDYSSADNAENIIVDDSGNVHGGLYNGADGVNSNLSFIAH